MTGYDAIVVGVGGIGSAALYHLARRGLRVLGLDRFGPAHDRGSSHGQTRIIRQAYFEHADYVPLVLRAYEGWRELSERTNTDLLNQVGLLQVGAADGSVLEGVRASAAEHDLDVDPMTAEQVERRFPGFRVHAPMSGVFERQAGYLRVEDCVRAHLDAATALGAEVRTGEEVLQWRVSGRSIDVETNQGRYQAESAVVTAGAWAGELLRDLNLPLVVLRKPLYWYLPHTTEYRVESGCPTFLYETAAGIFYGFPQIGAEGVKVAEHTGGAVVADPLHVDRTLDRPEQQRVEAFLKEHLPGLTATCSQHAVCMYTMTPDQHFVIDRHPAHPRVAFAAGFSGHGFKFAPAIGEALADLATHGTTNLPIDFLSRTRPALRPA